MPTIITHNAPHLDEIAAIWLLHRFVARWGRAKISYVASNTIKRPIAERALTMYLGVGRGMFDEHKGDAKHCCATLVYQHLLKQKKILLTPAKKAALDELLAYVNEDDHGTLINAPRAEFSIGSVNTYCTLLGATSAELTAFGETYLDAVYAALVEKYTLQKDWRSATAFKSRWGRAVGIETEVNAKVVLRRASQEGAHVVVVINPKNKFRSIRSLPHTAVDLTSAYTVVKKLEPKAEWYLHHSKRMLICGSDVAANIYLSKMPLRALIKLVSA